MRGLVVIVAVSFWYSPGSAANLDLSAAQRDFDRGFYAKVVKDLSPKVELLKRDGLILLAKAYSASGNSPSAIKTLTAALALNSKDLEVKTMMGEEYYLSGKERDALEVLKEVITLNKKYIPAYRQLIRIYEKSKNKYELRLLYQDLVEAVGMRSEFANKLCSLSTQDGLYDLSLNYCQKGISLNKKEPENFVNLGITYKSTGQEELGEKILKKSAQQFPLSWLAQFTYARHLEEKKDFINAYRAYKKAAIADKKNVESVLGVAFSAIEIQKFSEALEAFKMACNMEKSTIVHFRRGLNLVRTYGNKDWSRKFDQAVDNCD